jgi:hypothetical protein
MVTLDHEGNVLGRSEYLCDECLFVPKFHIKIADEVQYYVRPDTCFFGMCILCLCCDSTKKAAKCCRVPFYIRDPATKEKLDGGEAYISDLWAGWKHECCTQRDLYAVKFPSNATTAAKAAIMGAAHLMDITIFEQEDG